MLWVSAKLETGFAARHSAAILAMDTTMSLLMTELVAETLLFAFALASIVLHEAGHAIAGLAGGLDVRAVTIGIGPALARYRAASVLLVWRAIPLSGFVSLAAHPGMSRRAYVIMLAAGPATNAVIAGGAYAAAQAWPDQYIWLMPLWLANALTLTVALIPYRSRGLVRRRASDGLQLWRHLVHKPPPDLFREQYRGIAGLVLAAGTPLPEPSPNAPDLFYQMVRSDRLQDAWSARDASDAVRRIVARPSLTSLERALAYDLLAGGAVLFGGMGATHAELDHWSTEAALLTPGPPTAITRGGVLAALGRGEEAEAILRPLLEGAALPAQKVLCLLFLARAAMAQFQPNAARVCLAEARAAASAKGASRRLLLRLVALAEHHVVPA